jgi:hypothetical protein
MSSDRTMAPNVKLIADTQKYHIADCVAFVINPTGYGLARIIASFSYGWTRKNIRPERKKSVKTHTFRKRDIKPQHIFRRDQERLAEHSQQ